MLAARGHVAHLVRGAGVEDLHAQSAAERDVQRVAAVEHLRAADGRIDDGDPADSRGGVGLVDAGVALGQADRPGVDDAHTGGRQVHDLAVGVHGVQPVVVVQVLPGLGCDVVEEPQQLAGVALGAVLVEDVLAVGALDDLLRAFGIKKVFGNPGSTELPFLADWPDDIDYVLGLQEASVVGMADGYAQATRNAGFVNLHSAAGVGNALGNIYTAHRNQTPLVITAGQQARSILPLQAFLYAERASEFPRPYVKYSVERVRDPKIGLGQFALQGKWFQTVETPGKYTVVLKSDQPRPLMFDFFEYLNIADKDSLEGPDAHTKLVGTGAFLTNRRKQIIALAAHHSLRTIYPFREFAVDGGLISYGNNVPDTFRQGGVYAGRVLKGDKPADLPVILSSKFEFVLNLKTAKSIGLAISPMIRVRAGEVIE